MRYELIEYKSESPEFELVETKRVSVAGAEFDESFLAELLRDYFAKQAGGVRPTITTAFRIYMQESGGERRRKFAADAKHHFENFKGQFGDIYLDELKHYHAALYRDAQLAKGLNPTSVRKHMACFSAMLNVAFRYLSIDRLSPFRSLSILNEGKFKRHMPIITRELTLAVKQRLIELNRPNGYVGLIQLNTGCRL